MRKKIYIINQYYHPFFAATGQLLKELAEYLVQNSFEVVVITGTNGNKNLKKEENINGVRIFRIRNLKDDIFFKKKILSYITFYWSLFWFLLFSTEKRSAILSLSTPPLITLLPVLLKKIKKYKIIYNIQDLYPDILLKIGNNKIGFFYKFSKFISQIIFNKSDKIVLVDDSMKKFLKRNYRINLKKLIVIENWALKEIEDYKFYNLIINNNKLRVLYSGNMGRAHEYETILMCIKELQKNEISSIEFIFIGGGYNYNKLKNKTKDINFVKFYSYVEKNKLPEILNESDICLVIGSEDLCGIIVPSKFYGIVAAGKPIIYINSGEDIIYEHIRRGNLGYKINNGDYLTLYNILINLYRDRIILNKLYYNVKSYYAKHLKREISLEKYKKFFEKL